MSKQSKKERTEAQVAEVQAAAAVVEENGVKFGQVRKYEKAHAQSLTHITKGDTYIGSATWKYKDAMIAAGKYAPKKMGSVHGKIHDFALKNGPMKGSDLVTQLFNLVSFEDQHRSAYVSGGKPTPAWIEGYINGGLSKSREHLAIIAG